jgi:putative transposase
MARPLRVEYGGAIYHITVRGNARQKIFRGDLDRRTLLKRLSLSVRSYGVRVFLYCLMDNHFHLVLETPRANLGRFMQSVLTGYTVSYNLRHRRCGHLFQGRYGARLVAGDDYLLKLSRYVHLNPVNGEGERVADAAVVRTAGAA